MKKNDSVRNDDWDGTVEADERECCECSDQNQLSGNEIGCSIPVRSKDRKAEENVWRFLTRLLYEKNPFYLISALLLIYAQSVLFTSDPLMERTEIPAVIIAIYALLMTGAGVWIVRKGRVWDDAASIFLILQVLFLVMSVTMDGLLLNSPLTGRFGLAGCLLLATGMTGALFWGLRLRVPHGVLVVYGCVLGLFFLAPAYIAARVTDECPVGEVCLLILGFPLLAGFLFLLLLPWINTERRNELMNTGTPWRWPGFPWSVFLIFAVGVVFRTYMLAISFIGGKGAGPYANLESGFAPYMVVPFLFLLAFLILEASVSEKKNWLFWCAMGIPCILIVLSLIPNRNAGGREFLQALPFWYSPIWGALTLATAFYAWSWFRRLKHADVFFYFSLVLLCIPFLSLGQQTSDFLREFMSMIPPFTLLVILLFQAIRRKSSLCYFLCGSIVNICILIMVRNFSGGDCPIYWERIVVFGLILSAYLPGALNRDRFSDALNIFCMILLPFYCLCMARVFKVNGWEWSLLPFPVLSLLMMIAGALWIDFRYRISLGFTGTIVFFYVIGRQLRLLAKLRIRGLGWMIAAALFFGIAFMISLKKGRERRLMADGNREDK